MYALAVKIHMKNTYEEKQIIDPSNADAKPSLISMYDVLQRGLGKIADRNAGKIKEADLKDWEKEAMNDAQAFEYMIRVRENFLPLMTLAQVTKANIKGFLNIPGLLTSLKLYFKSWTADLASLNVEQIITYTKWINDPEGALGARGVLEQLGVDATLNPTVVKIYKNMQVDGSNLPKAANEPEAVNMPSPVQNFKQAIADLLRGA